MTYLIRIWAMLCLSAAPVVLADTVWFDQEMEPSTQAKAAYVLDSWEKVDDRGYRVALNYVSGARYLEASVRRLDFESLIFIGPYRKYYESGGLKKEGFRTLQGEWHGILTHYDEAGATGKQESYLNGERHGPQVRYFANGRVQQREHFEHGNQVGEQWQWHVNGEKKSYQLLNEHGHTEVLRTYHVDGSLIQLQEPIDSDYGPARLRQEYNAYGKLEEERMQSDNRRWRLFKGYNEKGELTDRSEFVDRKRDGWFVQTRWTGAVERVQYRAGLRHGTYERTNGKGEVVISGQYDQGNRKGEWIYIREDEKTTESYGE